MSQKKKVVVVGAAGSTGEVVVEKCLEQGYSVVAVDLPGSRIKHRTSKNLKIRQGSPLSTQFMERCVQGADYLINCIANDDERLKYKVLEPLNLDTVKVLYKACHTQKLRQFVHLSSGSVYQNIGKNKTEETLVRPENDFERITVKAEKFLEAQAKKTKAEVKVSVLRPGIVYGTRDHGLGATFASIAPTLRWAFLYIPNLKGGARTSWIHREDLARAAVFLLGKQDSQYENFNVADDEPMSFGELSQIGIESYDLPLGTQFTLPTLVIAKLEPFFTKKWFTGLLKVTMGYLWKKVRNRYQITDDLFLDLNMELLKCALYESILNNGKLKQLGFECTYPNLRIGFPEAVRWYQDHGWAPELPSSEEEEEELAQKTGLGFQFRESMKGYVVEKSGLKSQMKLTILVRAPKITTFLRTAVADLSGILFIEGFADRVPIEGTLEIKLIAERALLYDFGFVGSDQKSYRIVGQKTIESGRIASTWSRFEGTVIDESGNSFAKAHLNFDIKHDVIPFLLSFRFIQNLPVS